MMPHVRAQIREYVRAQLTTIPGLELSVTLDSEEIPNDFALPWVHVHVGDEDIDAVNLGGPVGRKLTRALQLTTDIYCRGRSEPLLEAESYAAAIETKLASSPRMGGLASDTRLRAYTISRNDEGSTPIVQMRLQWLVTYFTNERDATVPA